MKYIWSKIKSVATSSVLSCSLPSYLVSLRFHLRQLKNAKKIPARMYQNSLKNLKVFFWTANLLGFNSAHEGAEKYRSTALRHRKGFSSETFAYQKIVNFQGLIRGLSCIIDKYYEARVCGGGDGGFARCEFTISAYVADKSRRGPRIITVEFTALSRYLDWRGRNVCTCHSPGNGRRTRHRWRQPTFGSPALRNEFGTRRYSGFMASRTRGPRKRAGSRFSSISPETRDGFMIYPYIRRGRRDGIRADRSDRRRRRGTVRPVELRSE